MTRLGAVVETEDVVVDPVGVALRHQLEGLAEHGGVLLLVNLSQEDVTTCNSIYPNSVTLY